MTLDRRQFFVSSGVALAAPLAPLAACATAGGSISVPPADRKAAQGEPASPDIIAAAEHVMEVEYSAQERALIGASLEEQLELVRKRRALDLPFELAPAVTFDPVLPGASSNGRSRAHQRGADRDLPRPAQAARSGARVRGDHDRGAGPRAGRRRRP